MSLGNKKQVIKTCAKALTYVCDVLMRAIHSAHNAILYIGGWCVWLMWSGDSKTGILQCPCRSIKVLLFGQGLNVLPVSVWVLSSSSGFLSESKVLHLGKFEVYMVWRSLSKKRDFRTHKDFYLLRVFLSDAWLMVSTKKAFLQSFQTSSNTKQGQKSSRSRYLRCAQLFFYVLG